MHILRVVSGPARGEKIEVRGDVVIGREGADLTITDSEISRRHAIVRPAGRGVMVEDLGSMNGTIVDGKRIGAPVTLTLGGKIEIGSSVIEAELVQESPTKVRGVPVADPVAAPSTTKVTATQPPAGPPPATEPPPSAAAQPPPEPPARAPGKGAGPSRKPLLPVLGALAAVAAIVIAVLALTGGDDSADETKKRAFTGRGLTAVISPTALNMTIAGQVRAKPVGRMALVIRRSVSKFPEPGGPAVPLNLKISLSQPGGSFENQMSGTVRLARNGTEIVRGRARVVKGTGEYDGIKGSFTLKGDNAPKSVPSLFDIAGRLEY